MLGKKYPPCSILHEAMLPCLPQPGSQGSQGCREGRSHNSWVLWRMGIHNLLLLGTWHCHFAQLWWLGAGAGQLAHTEAISHRAMPGRWKWVFVIRLFPTICYLEESTRSPSEKCVSAMELWKDKFWLSSVSEIIYIHYPNEIWVHVKPLESAQTAEDKTLQTWSTLEWQH